MDGDDGPRLLRSFGALLVPPRCGLCEAGCRTGEQLCGHCARDLRRALTFGEHRLAGLDWAWAAFAHRGVPRRLVAAAKYRSRVGLLGLAAGEIAGRLPVALAQGGGLVPVPPDPWRSRRRGFDCAAELARQLGALTGLEVVEGLRRARGAPQAGKGRAERLAAAPRLSISARASMPRTVVLVDDVVTTGTTLRACAGAAREAGAVALGAVTLTRKTYGL